MANPVISQLNRNHSTTLSYPGALPGTSSLDKVLNKTLMLFALLIPVALVAAFLTPPAMMATVMMASMGATLVLGLIMAFSRRASLPLVFLYTVAEGALLGSISVMYEGLWDGIVLTAITATTVTAAVIILGQRFGFLRTSSRARKMFGYLALGYMAFVLVVFLAALAGFSVLTFGSPLSLAVSVFGVAMACFSLLVDVENVAIASRSSIDDKQSWFLAFGLMTSLVWLYLEILRLVANLSSLSR